MKKKKWLASFGLSTLLVASVLSGCSSNGTKQTASNGSNSNGGGKTGNVTLRVGTWEGGDALKLQQQIAKNYMQSHSNVKIKIESVPDQYGTKLLTQIAAGTAPDIFQIGDGDVSMFAAKGAIENLNPYVKGSNGMNLDMYYKNVLKIGKVNGKLYTLPKDYSDEAIFYNKKLFDKAGIPYPKAGWTWKDFYKAAKKLTIKKGGKTVQWGAEMPGAQIRNILPLIYAYGGSVISPDGKKYVGYLNSKGTVKAMKIYKNMYFKDGITPTSTTEQSFKGVDLFSTGKVAMLLMGNWPITTYNANPNLKYGTVSLPVGPSGPENTIFYAGYGLNSASKNKKAAWDYLKYLTGPKGSKILTKHAFSAIKSVAKDTGQTSDPILKPFINGIKYIKTIPSIRSKDFRYGGGKTFQNFLNKLMLNKIPNVAKALDQAAKKAQQLVKQHKMQ